jgi:hypothetical protein
MKWRNRENCAHNNSAATNGACHGEACTAPWREAVFVWWLPMRLPLSFALIGAGTASPAKGQFVAGDHEPARDKPGKVPGASFYVEDLIAILAVEVMVVTNLRELVPRASGHINRDKPALRDQVIQGSVHGCDAQRWNGLLG